MNPVTRAGELLTLSGQPNAILPATALFNEGWMLRLVLDWAANHCHPAAIVPLRFEDGSTWYSEALLRSRFRSRKRGDTSGEGFTHADGVIGHFRLRSSGTQARTATRAHPEHAPPVPAAGVRAAHRVSREPRRPDRAFQTPSWRAGGPGKPLGGGVRIDTSVPGPRLL